MTLSLVCLSIAMSLVSRCELMKSRSTTPLLGYVGVVLGGLCLHQFVTYSLLVRYLAGLNPRLFFRQISEVMMTAFSTSSSNATLPTALRVTQEKLGVPRDIASFVLTLGS